MKKRFFRKDWHLSCGNSKSWYSVITFIPPNGVPTKNRGQLTRPNYIAFSARSFMAVRVFYPGYVNKLRVLRRTDSKSAHRKNDKRDCRWKCTWITHAVCLWNRGTSQCEHCLDWKKSRRRTNRNTFGMENIRHPARACCPDHRDNTQCGHCLQRKMYRHSNGTQIYLLRHLPRPKYVCGHLSTGSIQYGLKPHLRKSLRNVRRQICCFCRQRQHVFCSRSTGSILSAHCLRG